MDAYRMDMGRQWIAAARFLDVREVGGVVRGVFIVYDHKVRGGGEAMGQGRGEHKGVAKGGLIEHTVG